MRFLANWVWFLPVTKALNHYSSTLSAVKCPNLCTASYLWVLISLWSVSLSHPSESSLTSLACSRGAAEWSGLWLCGSFPPTWVTGLDAGCCHFSGCLQICLQEWKHPPLFPLPSQSRGLQQQRRGPFQPSDHHLLSRGRCALLWPQSKSFVRFLWDCTTLRLWLWIKRAEQQNWMFAQKEFSAAYHLRSPLNDWWCQTLHL